MNCVVLSLLWPRNRLWHTTCSDCCRGRCERQWLPPVSARPPSRNCRRKGPLQTSGPGLRPSPAGAAATWGRHSSCIGAHQPGCSQPPIPAGQILGLDYSRNVPQRQLRTSGIEQIGQSQIETDGRELTGTGQSDFDRPRSVGLQEGALMPGQAVPFAASRPPPAGCPARQVPRRAHAIPGPLIAVRSAGVLQAGLPGPCRYGEGVGRVVREPEPRLLDV